LLTSGDGGVPQGFRKKDDIFEANFERWFVDIVVVENKESVALRVRGDGCG